MIAFALGLLLIALGLLALALQRFYSSIPVHELKRLSRKGDQLAHALYRAAAFGSSLRTLLWLVSAAFVAGGLLLIVPNVPGVVGFVMLAVTLLIALIWVPSARLTVHTAQLAATVAPVLAAVLQRTHTLLAKLAGLVNRGRKLAYHTHLYEKDDLTTLLHHQKEQQDNRISLEDLELAHRALQFGDKQAADIAAPRKNLYVVNADDSVGPILLDQLHKSGQTSFLVYKDQKENIVGSLLMRDAVNARQGGRVADLIRGDLCYVHEDFSLRQVLGAFQKTGHHTAVVINNFEESIGVITLDRLLRELVSEAVADQENYENRSAIAAYRTKKETQAAEAQETEIADQAEPDPQTVPEQTQAN